MKPWTPQQVAAAAGARLISEPPTEAGPERVSIDSRDAGPGTLFVGLAGANADGGRFSPQALEAGAWGILTTEQHAEAAKAAGPGVRLAAEDPLKALQSLATAWRRELGAQVIGVTGSTGKTSTKELIRAVIERRRRTVASRANFNTEIGLPLEILAAPEGTEVLVLEMGMRGAGQIAELAAIAEPDVGVIVNLGPVHMELLGSLEAIAATKAELIAALPPGGTAVLPAGEPLLEPHRREDLRTLTFGEGGDVRLRAARGERIEIDLAGEPITLEVSFSQAHLRRNLLAAVAAASAIGVRAGGRIELEISAGRGRRLELASGITLIDDCYNANPMSMRAALDDLAATATRGRGRAARGRARGHARARPRRASLPPRDRRACPRGRRRRAGHGRAARDVDRRGLRVRARHLCHRRRRRGGRCRPGPAQARRPGAGQGVARDRPGAGLRRGHRRGTRLVHCPAIRMAH